MRYTNLKKANIRISNIGLGTNAVGGHNLYSNLDEEEGKLVVREALHQGITFFDTADSYGFGRSEQLLGEAFKKDRTQVILATKGANERLEDGIIQKNNTPAYLRKALEASLRRLQTDYVDIYYIHYPDGKTPLGEAVAELVRMKEEGKIRAIGISNLTLDQLKEANVHNDIDVFQSRYNMLERSADIELLPYCIKNEISFVPYGPLAFGILGGKYGKYFRLDKTDWRNKVRLFEEDIFQDNLQKVYQLKNLASRMEMTLPDLALAWLLHQDGIDTVIPGAKRADQVTENAKASDMTLTRSELLIIDDILNA